MHKISHDGKNYFIPLPAQYYGYICNVTFLKETGLAVPTTQKELFDVLKTAKEKNIGTDENGNVFTTDGTPAVAATFAIATQITDFFGLSEDIK